MNIAAAMTELGAGVEAVNLDEQFAAFLQLVLEHGAEHAKPIIVQIQDRVKRPLRRAAGALSIPLC